MEDAEDEQPKKQLQSDRGGAGRGRKTAIGTGGPDDADWQWQQALPDHQKLRAIVCHKHDLLREGLCAMLEPVAKVIAQFSDGKAALNEMAKLTAKRWLLQSEKSVIRHKLQLVVLDFDLGQVNAIDVCRQFAVEPAAPNFLIYSDSYHLTKYLNRLIRAGAKAFCLNSSSVRSLHDAVSHCSRDLPYCDPVISNLVRQQSITEKRQGWSTTKINPDLNEREIEVLIRLDMKNNEIAEELDMKPRTVEKHVECILAKLKTPTRTAAALKALSIGYRMLPNMPQGDPETGKSIEQIEAEDLALWAIECKQRHKDKKLNKFVALTRDLTVRQLAQKLSVSDTEIIKRLMMKGFMRTHNQIVELPIARELAKDMGFEVREGDVD